MADSQSGAENNNRLLFREQVILLFSKSKMTTTNFSQSGADLKVQDGGAYESESMMENSQFRPNGGHKSIKIGHGN